MLLGWLGAASLPAACLIICSLLYFQPRPPLLEGIPFGAAVLDDRGNLLRLGLSADQKYRLRIEADAIPGDAARALLRYEDRFFYSHPGVNPFSILRAAIFPGGARPGASTITMQVARLRYGLKTSSVRGKLRQIWLALLLERHYSKKEILEAYFNLAPYGGNIEGIEAASRIYFNKAASQLTELECLALAVTPQNPAARRPDAGRDSARARARLEASLAGASPGEASPLRVRSPAQLPFLAPHLSAELLARENSGEIRTFIQKDLQAMLERSLLSFTRRGRAYGVENAAAMLVDRRGMQVRAYAGSADFFDSGISGQVDGARAKRSPGSTLKPFIYALALDQGLIHPMTMLPDSPRSFGGYDPENFDRGFRGPLPAHEALKASRNLPAIILAEKLKNPDLYEFLLAGGASLDKDRGHYGLALALGGAEISMRDLAALYAMLANQGIWRPLRFTRGDDSDFSRRLLSPEAAWLVLWMLERKEAVIRSGGASIPLRVKTGTSNGLKDAWAAGLVGDYVLVVWVGDFVGRSNPFFVGARTALPLFGEMAQSLGRLRRLEDRGEEPPLALKLQKAQICASTGDLDQGHCGEALSSWLIPGVSPTRQSGVLRPVLVHRDSGLRACPELAAESEEVWLEFWPSDMRRIFERAGIHKPQPPEWHPLCRGAKAVAARAPRIILPKKGVAYQKETGGREFRLPLMAAADPEASLVHWYSGSSYIGSAKPGETIFWNPPRSGLLDILAVDDLGGDARIKCRIEALPGSKW